MGKGAVLCTWLILIDTRAEMDICTPGKSSSFREDLSWAIDATNEFIFANSPTPITKGMLEEVISRRLSDVRAKMAAGEPTIVDCQLTRRENVDSLETQSREDFRSRIADFLSVPRKPLMYPCL
jgi:hypothetical protein